MSEIRSQYSVVEKAWTCLLSMLRMAVAKQSDSPGPLAPAEWREVYRLAARHAVIAVAWDGIEHVQSLSPDVLQSMPTDLMGKWFADAQAIEASNCDLAKQAATIQSQLTEAGFESQILKGSSLAAYYPVPAHRQSADIDLWVTQSDSPHVSLQALRQALLAYLQKQPAITVGEIVYHHIETMHNGIEVEYHVTPTWLCNPIHNSRLQTLFAQTGQMTSELQELYTLLHAFRHIYHDGIALRHILDYWFVSRHNRQAGVQPPQDLYRQLGLTTFVHAMNEVTEYIFGENEPKQLSSRAKHILSALPERRVSCAVKWDYPTETLFNVPWRGMHYLWRKKNHYV